MTLKDRRLNSTTFQAWKMNVLNFTTFQVFHDLYEPFYSLAFISLTGWKMYLKLQIDLKTENWRAHLVHPSNCKAYQVAWIASTINN